MLKKFFNRLLRSGLDTTADILAYQRILLTNSIAIAVMAFCILLFAIAVWFSLYNHIVITLITCGMMFPVFWLNRKNKMLHSSMYLVHFGGAAIFIASYFAYSDGRITETENWYYAFFSICIFLFDRWIMYLNLWWFFLLIILTKYMKYTISGWEIDVNYTLTIINVVILCLALYVFLSIFKWGFKLTLSKLSESDQAKNKLFSIIAHDIRNPLSTFEMLINMGEEGALTQDQFIAYQKKVKEQFEPVKETVNSMLLWSQSNLNSIFPNPKLFRVKSVLTELIAALKPIADEKKIIVDLVSNNELVSMDEDHFKIIIRNIYHNALKFSSISGKVSILCKELNDYTIIEIIDSGKGIDEDKIAAILGGEAIKSDVGTAQEKGTGLGLLLSVELLKKNSGKIYIVNGIQGGSKFTIIIPK